MDYIEGLIQDLHEYYIIFMCGEIGSVGDEKKIPLYFQVLFFISNS